MAENPRNGEQLVSSKGYRVVSVDGDEIKLLHVGRKGRLHIEGGQLIEETYPIDFCPKKVRVPTRVFCVDTFSRQNEDGSLEYVLRPREFSEEEETEVVEGFQKWEFVELVSLSYLTPSPLN